MAEERDDLTAANERPNADAARGRDPEDIERGIRETRAEMSETLDAIGARFRPDYIKEQAKDALRSTARDAGTTMIDTIKENPIPSLIAGLSIGWLIARGGRSDHDRYGRYDDNNRQFGRYPDYRGYDEPYGYGRYDTGYYGQGEVGDRSLKDKAADVAGDAKQKVSDLAGQAGEQLHEIGDDVQYYGRQATNWLEYQMNANPLAVGAVALAAGALVGLAVPGTQKEDELMGEARERLTEKVKDVAEEKLGQVKVVARETAGEVKEKAREVAETAKEEARNQGLTSGGSGHGSAAGMSGPASSGNQGGTRAPSGSTAEMGATTKTSNRSSAS